MLSEERRADSLQCEEQSHARYGSQEEETTSELVAEGRGQDSPEQVPDLQDTVDEQLGVMSGHEMAVIWTRNLTWMVGFVMPMESNTLLR